MVGLDKKVKDMGQDFGGNAYSVVAYAHDDIIRPYLGDVLVVMLLYCFIRSFLKLNVTPTTISVLLFAYLVETLQYFNIVERLGLKDSPLANIVIGNYFTWIDILAYTLGALVVLAFEIRWSRIRKANKQLREENLWLFL